MKFALTSEPHARSVRADECGTTTSTHSVSLALTDSLDSGARRVRDTTRQQPGYYRDRTNNRERAELKNADFRRNSELVSARTELPEQSEFASGHSIQW